MNRQELESMKDILEEIMAGDVSVEDIALQLDAKPEDIRAVLEGKPKEPVKKTTARATKSTRKAESKTNESSSKMDKIRSVYNKLYRGIPLGTVSDEEYYNNKGRIETARQKKKKKTEGFSKLSSEEQVSTFVDIKREVDSIINFNIPYQIALELKGYIDAINKAQRAGLKNKFWKTPSSQLKDMQDKLSSRAAIDIQRRATFARTPEEIDYLVGLESPVKNDSFFEQRKVFYRGSLLNRKTSIIQGMRSADMRKMVDPDMKALIEEFLSVSTDIEEVKTHLKEAAEKELSKTDDGLGYRRVRKETPESTIIYQIRTLLMDRPDLFPIKENQIPEIESRYFSIVGNDSYYTKGMIAKVIGANLIGQGEYAAAKNYSEKRKYLPREIKRRAIDEGGYDPEVKSYVQEVKRIKTDAIGAELGELLLNRIRGERDEEKDATVMDIVDKQLEPRDDGKRISMSLINLGYDENGIRKITLADIYSDRSLLR